MVWLWCLSAPHHWAMLSSSCLSPSHVRIALMAVSLREASHLSHSSEGLAVIGSAGALRTMSSASTGSVGWRNRSAFGPPPAQSLRASRSKVRSLLSSSIRAVCRGSSLASSRESSPRQTRRGRRDVSWRSSSTSYGRSSFLQNRSRLRARIDPVVATLYFLRSALFDTWVTCAGTLATCRRHLVAHLSSFVIIVVIVVCAP